MEFVNNGVDFPAAGEVTALTGTRQIDRPLDKDVLLAVIQSPALASVPGSEKELSDTILKWAKVFTNAI